jgi:signal peptidase II
VSDSPPQAVSVPAAAEVPVSQSQRVAGAATHAASWARLILVAVPGLALDLWSKAWAFQTLRQGGRVELVPSVLEFQTMLNSGALFGIGGGQTTLFLLASSLALILVGWMFTQTSRRDRLLHLALGAILAGALGNMYDRAFVLLLHDPVHTTRGLIYFEDAGPAEGGRLIREYPASVSGPDQRPPISMVVPQTGREVGFVRDFLKIPTRWLGGRELWPWVFNVADTLLVCGVGVLGVHLLFGGRRKRPAPASPMPSGV